VTDLEEELEQLRSDVVVPDAAAKRRIAARLSGSISALPRGSARGGQRAFPWSQPVRLAVSFVLGGMAGAGLYGALRPPKVERIYLERPAASAPVPTAKVIPDAAPFEPPLASSRLAAPVSAPSAVVVDRKASLAEQQALLDVARVAFARGKYPQTLQTLAAHSARFPKSVLAEEREALQIKALAASDRLPEARTRALRFKAQFPQSLLLPSIKDSVGAIP
jgi:hypothetical protein